MLDTTDNEVAPNEKFPPMGMVAQFARLAAARCLVKLAGPTRHVKVGLKSTFFTVFRHSISIWHALT